MEWAAKTAVKRGIPLLVIHVVPSVPVPARTSAAAMLAQGPDLVAKLMTQTQTMLNTVADHLTETFPGLQVETAIGDGNPGRVLADAAKDADLVVVGARGKSAPASVRLLGGNADVVSVHAPGTIAVIPEYSQQRADGPVVVGVDQSREAQIAIARAFEAAHTAGVPLVALNAWDYGPYDAYNADVWEHSIDQMTKELIDEVEKIIADDRRAFPDVEVEIRVVRGRAHTALIEASKDANLVFVGSRGRGGFKGLLLGSTSKRVLRDASCPVVICRGEAGWTNPVES